MTIHKLLADFQAWLGDRADVADVEGVETYLRLKSGRPEPDACHWTCADVQSLVEELAPDALPDGELLGELMPSGLDTLLEFLHATGRFRHGSDPYDDLRHALDRAMAEVEEQLEWQEANAEILDVRAGLATFVGRERGDLPTELTGDAAATRLVADLLGLRELVRNGVRVLSDAFIMPADRDQICEELGPTGRLHALDLWYIADRLFGFRFDDGCAYLTADAAETAPAGDTALAEVWRGAVVRYLRGSGAGGEWGYDDWLTVNTVLLKLRVAGAQSLGELGRWLDFTRSSFDAEDSDDDRVWSLVPPLEYTGLARAEGGQLTLTVLGRWFVHQHNGSYADGDFTEESDGEFEPFHRAVEELIAQVRRQPASPVRSPSECGELARTTPLVEHLLGLRELLRPGLRVGKDRRPTPSSAGQIVEALGLPNLFRAELGDLGPFELLEVLWDVLTKLGWVRYKGKRALLRQMVGEFAPDSNKQVSDLARTATRCLLDLIDTDWPFEHAAADAVMLRLYNEPSGQAIDVLARWLEEVAFSRFGGQMPDKLRRSLSFHLRRAGRLLDYAGLATLHDDRMELTPLGQSHVVDHFGFAEEPEIDLDDLARQPVDALVDACLSEPERAGEFTLSWLRDREADAGARELLAFAGSASGDEQTGALLACTALGSAVADAYRATLDEPTLRPYAQLCLIGHRLASPAEAESFLHEVWRSDLFVVVPLLKGIADSHPDKAIRKSARKALYKARSRAA